MVNRVWRGGTGEWLDASQWQTTTAGAPPNFPQPGDTVTVGSGTVDLAGPTAQNDGTFDNNAVTLGTAGGTLTTLTATNAILNNGFVITAIGPANLTAIGRSTIEGNVIDNASGASLTLGSVADGAEAGDLVFARGSSLTLNGTQSLVLQGMVTFEAGAGFTAPGSVAVVNNGVVEQIGTADTIDGSLSGTGTWNLNFSTSLLLAGSVSAGQSFALGLDGRLQLADTADFRGTVSGLAPGDLIDFTAVIASNAVYDPTAHILTLNNGAGTATVAQIGNVTASAGTLVASSDGSGGTVVSYAGTPSREKYEIAGADTALQSNVVRTTMTVPGTSTPITGAGVKIGILSDSFDQVAPGSANADAAAGYLPSNANGTSAVTVLSEGAAGTSDEGRALAELLYAVAPGAQLYFEAAGTSPTSVASGVNALAAAGVNIIVDDVSFGGAPMFQVDGLIDAAVSAAIAQGVNYFTSAGNQGDAYLQQSFAPATTTLYDGTTVKAQVFDNGTAYDTFTVPAGRAAAVDLQWTAPYEGPNNRGAADALVFKIFDASGTLVATSAQTSLGGVNTTDIVATVPAASAATTYQIAVYLNGLATQPSAFKFTVSSAGGAGSAPGALINDPQAATGSGDVNGQALIPGVNTVGAVYYGDSAAYGQVPDATEYYSNTGPGTLLYSSTGQPLSPAQAAGKVDFVAPDGVNTTVPGFAGFFGTSAAAPDAAAVAALVLQAAPKLTTAQVSAALAGSAVSLGLSAAVQGAGLIQAPAAVALAESMACYCRGTLMLTDEGERPVEDLVAGDRLITVSGAAEPLVWLGRRGYAGRFLTGRTHLLPVRIRAGALGAGIPRRDLCVSPQHAMLIDGLLIPASALLNGTTIVRDSAATAVDYFHLELAQHDAIWAEGAPSETFVDDGSRGVFTNAHERPATTGPAVYCAPRATSGHALERIRRRLARAMAA